MTVDTAELQRLADTVTPQGIVAVCRFRRRLLTRTC